MEAVVLRKGESLRVSSGPGGRTAEILSCFPFNLQFLYIHHFWNSINRGMENTSLSL